MLCRCKHLSLCLQASKYLPVVVCGYLMPNKLWHIFLHSISLSGVCLTEVELYATKCPRVLWIYQIGFTCLDLVIWCNNSKSRLSLCRPCNEILGHAIFRQGARASGSVTRLRLILTTIECGQQQDDHLVPRKQGKLNWVPRSF